jgi:RHS repeat-associated protein
LILSLKDERQRFVMVEKTNIPGHLLLVRYLHDSHQGSCTLETDESGNVITYEEYHPFGTSSYQATNAGILSSSKRYRYVGKERDEESGLYYYGARFYAPWLCRFMSCDPKAAQFPDQSPYNYCFNNPINLIDPDGMEPEGPDDPPTGSESNPILLDEVEISSTRTYPSAVSTGATSTPRADDITPGPNWLSRTLNTPENREKYRTTMTAISLLKYESSGGESGKYSDDEHVTTDYLFHQWVFGNGKSEHTFTENSIMGRQMLATSEIQGAMQTALTKAASGDNSSTGFTRSAGVENKAHYIKSFFTDLHDNPARAMHGSFFGDITTESNALPDGNNLLVTMTVRFTDEMTAISATHIPGSYDKSAIGYTNNPYGENGQFRTITNN